MSDPYWDHDRKEVLRGMVYIAALVLFDCLFLDDCLRLL